MRTLTWVVLLVPLAGCGQKPDAPFAELHPVKGVVKQAGSPVKGGAVQFLAEPTNTAFAVNAEVGDDGTFTLTTVRTTDSKGERKPGAPAGVYKVVYSPAVSDQTAGEPVGPIVLPAPVTVNAGSNELTIDLSKK